MIAIVLISVSLLISASATISLLRSSDFTMLCGPVTVTRTRLLLSSTSYTFPSSSRSSVLISLTLISLKVTVSFRDHKSAPPGTTVQKQVPEKQASVPDYVSIIFSFFRLWLLPFPDSQILVFLLRGCSGSYAFCHAGNPHRRLRSSSPSVSHTDLAGLLGHNDRQGIRHL